MSHVLAFKLRNARVWNKESVIRAFGEESRWQEASWQADFKGWCAYRRWDVLHSGQGCDYRLIKGGGQETAWWDYHDERE